MMPQFTRDRVSILPHADEYRRLYDISVKDVLSCLGDPDTNVGLATDHYIAKKTIGSECIYVNYHLALPLQGNKDEVYVIVDFVGYTIGEDCF